jgi:hypothetical protein
MRFYSTGGTSKIQLSSNSGGTSNLSSTFTEAQNTQYHNVIVYTPTLMKWYVNGVLISSVTPSVGTFDARRYMTIGGSRNAGQSVNGLMDEFRMYNRALPQDEVLTLYGQKNGFIGVSPRLTSTTTAPYGQCTNNLSCGLFNYWTFDGKDVVNGVFLDSSGAGNSLNATSISTSTFYAPGRVGQGIRMDGVDDVLVSQINTPFPASNQFAYSFWIRAPGLTSGSIISWGASRFCARNGTAMNCTVDGNTTGAASASAVWDGLWHHIVFVNDGNTQQIYKDGVLAGTATETLVTGAASIRIGNRPSSSSFLQADIDDVRIYGRLLSSTEALMLYGMGTTARGVSPKLTSTTTSPY